VARLDSLREMLRDDPDDAFTRYALAMELRAQGQPDAALEEFARLVERTPDYVPTYYHYGRALLDAGRDEEAEAVVRRGIEVAVASGDDHARSELDDLLDEIG